MVRSPEERGSAYANPSSEILKQPLHTTIAIDTLEFGEMNVEEKLHIVISVKDFKSIITHAGIANTIVKALYSHPSNPMQITYSDEGVFCEFILMTIGESRGSSATPAPTASRAASKRPVSRQPLEATPSSRRTASSNMPPPPIAAAASTSREAAKAKNSRPSPPPPQPSLPADSLFLPEDEDRRWDPVNYDEEDDEMLLWDIGGESVDFLVDQNLQVLTMPPGTNDHEFCSTLKVGGNPEPSCQWPQRSRYGRFWPRPDAGFRTDPTKIRGKSSKIPFDNQANKIGRKTRNVLNVVAGHEALAMGSIYNLGFRYAEPFCLQVIVLALEQGRMRPRRLRKVSASNTNPASSTSSTNT